MNILVELAFKNNNEDLLYSKLLDPSLFEILKISARKYHKNRNIFSEITIILQRIANFNAIKMKEFCTDEFIEFLNTELEREAEVKTEDDTLMFGNLRNLIQSLS
mmetsp:Transcript_27564/g.24427  ORF Transcript_27564/g.24427 Transcript_27564/m.24427 type:complete len:105 (+) Transcript_27564:136-450(+)